MDTAHAADTLPGGRPGRRPLPRIDDPNLDGHLSIGDLAAASGIATGTLRAWERRYGRPAPERLPSGHRRYRAALVPWLRRVAEALSRGHRPGKVVLLPRAELDALVRPEAGSGPDPEIRELLGMIRRLHPAALEGALLRDLRRLGPVEFLRRRAGPLLEETGRAWADGRIEVRHEHLLSEVLTGILQGLRAGIAIPSGAPAAVLATLPGEQHGLGLQMAAVHCALRGRRPVVLGVNTPVPDVARAAKEAKATAVLVSVSLATGGVATDRLLAELRRLLPAKVRLVAGGAGAGGPRRGPRGVETLDGLDALAEWLG